jgi:molybdopterin molybdotransferase
MLNVDQAKQEILKHAKLSVGTENIPLFESLGRRLAKDMVSAIDVPPADNSAMDGIALFSGDYSETGTRLSLSQRIAAGEAPVALQAGTAARIFTGAEIPEGADCVEMQENCTFHHEGAGNDSVSLNSKPLSGSNIRRRGQDIESGSQVLTAGQLLRSQEMGLLASIGIDQVPVFQKLKIGVFSSGDELVEPGTPLQSAQIYNSNRYTLAGLIQDSGCEFIDLGCVEDSLEATIALLRESSTKVDLLISSGGVSVGEEDHIKPAVEACGSLSVWKIALKPGKPLAMGEVFGTPFFGLPGNPVSGFATFLLFVKPYLEVMGGGTAKPLEWLKVPANFERPPVSREEYLRVCIVNGKAEIFPNQSSGVLSSVSWSTGFVRQKIDQSIGLELAVDYLPFESF